MHVLPVPDAATAEPLRSGSTILGGRITLRTLLEAESVAHGAPAVWAAESAGAEFIAKTWTKQPGDELAVRTIWNHEVRSLLRLDGLPRSREHFASLEQVGADARGYHIVIDGGGRQLLSDALSARNSHEWLRRLNQPQTRAALWRGLQRLAVGLTMLHDQGVLHRALTAGCVFTDMSGECDFRLSGFEWSLRLSAAAHGTRFGTGPGRMRAPEIGLGDGACSIASDWFDFGLLAADVIADLKEGGNDLDALNRLRRAIMARRAISEEERTVLLGLLLPNPDARRGECVGVPTRLAALSTRLASAQFTTSRPLLLGLHATSTGELASAIFRASGGRVRVDDAGGQVAFVQDDVRHRPAVAVRTAPAPHYVLHGRQLSYRVRRHEQRGGGLPTWRAGFIQGLDKGSREPGIEASLEGREVRVGPAHMIEPWLKDGTVRAMPWSEALPFPTAASAARGGDAHDFLRFTNTVDALFASARIWPVKVAERGDGRRGRGDWVALEAERDEDRDVVAAALGLERPARQMERAFVEEIGEIDGETAFHIVDGPRLEKQNRQAGRWVFQLWHFSGGARRYVFERIGGSAELPQGLAYLRPADLSGSYVLLERRLKAIEALRDQSAMLCALETPGSTSRDTLEDLEEDAQTALLDGPKREALRAIWRAQPMFALQGPPGTGKTALVEALVRHALSKDASLQIVATAQANATVDSLGGKLSKACQRSSAPEAPMVVRLDEDEEDQSALSPARLAQGMAETLAASRLGRSAPPHIASRLSALRIGSGQDGRREQGDMARLVSRSANVVLATTGSRGLSELLGEGKRFDWCLVEEAGKVHGFDLALPMLASHRMLMIGDHEQLPAFNEAAYRALLASPQKVREALGSAARLIPRKLGFDLGPLESDEAMEARCARWLPMVSTFGHVFTASNGLPFDSSPIAARLNEQHRMHPDICDLNRACFYPDLRTADVARERLARSDPFRLLDGSWLPSERIVFVDMPWIQSTPEARGQDCNNQGRMVLSNKAEAEAVVQVLGQLVAHDASDIQVLAPYNRQVGTIQDALSKAHAKGRLPHLGTFAMPQGRDERGATIDGFQGEEADVVVVSLVRNNHLAPPGGVGFLSERPRLNVMLSRARRKLVLVGSWEFFTKRAGEQEWKDRSSPLHHLAIVFRELEQACRNGTARRVPLPGAAR